MEQARVRAGKSERDGIPVFDTPADKPDDRCGVIGRIAEHTSEPGLLQAVILNGIVMSRRIPLAVYGRTRFQIERPASEAGREVVIGAGVAGLSFALRAAEHGKVAVITKGKFLDCSSAKAQGGIAAVWDRNDSFEDHVADTLDAGAGLCNEQAVRTIVEEGPDAIRELLEWGVNFDPGNQGEDYELAREGGHTKRRILHAKDATGLEITSKLLEAAKLHPNIELLEDHFAIDLITTTKLGLVTEDRVLGAYVLDRVSGEVEIFPVKTACCSPPAAAGAYICTLPIMIPPRGTA